MACEAVVSLDLILGRTTNRFNIFDPTKEIAELIRQELWSLKSILELDHFEESERSNALKEEILEAIPKFRDLLEDSINKSQSLDDLSSQEWIFDDKVRQEMISFVETMKKIKMEYNAKDPEKSNKESPPADEDFGGNTNDMVRVFDEDEQQLIHKLLTGRSRGQKLLYRSIILVVGMAGIGKTTIVKAIYNEQRVINYFDLRAFLRVGPDYHLKNILLDLLVCLSPDYNKVLGIEKSEEDLKLDLFMFLKGRRFLIVLDDVWDINYWNKIVASLPYDIDGSRVIVTTRVSGQTYNHTLLNDVHQIRFRNEEESWNIFCHKVFVPPGFEKVGKKIVKKCGGLPLGIISIANILSKTEKTLDYWEKVAKNENLLALATEEGSSMSETLFLSYRHLPPHLKECCLYFGVFPLNHEISVSKIVKLWVGEGLVQPKPLDTFEDTARVYLEDLVSHNIILVRQRSTSDRIKTCSAHYFFWHLFVRTTANKKIFHLINSYLSAFSEGIKCQHRLCIHKNALLGFKRVSESIESVSNVRSFLCTGLENQYPVSICSSSKSIKVLDALTIRLYKFPIGILELVELKYLAFTYDGKLPSSISRLKNLIYLIVYRYHMKIIDSSPSYMPTEIWNMQKLRHLQVMGSDLPHPIDGAQLLNLLTLLGVSGRSCTKEVFQSIPNLEQIGVRNVLQQGVYETWNVFDHLALLSRLNSFKCIVANPDPRSQRVLPLPKLVFPSCLTKLTLSGCGFEWKDLSIIGALEYLQVLKLQCYAFRGPEWVVDEKEFPMLVHLQLEDTDLVHWRVGYGCFKILDRLIIRHCYKLKEIPRGLELKLLKVIELVDCSPSALASVNQIVLEQQRESGNEQVQIQVYSSLDDQKHQLSLTP